MVTAEFLGNRSHRLSFDGLTVVRAMRADHDPAFAVSLPDHGVVLRIEQVDFQGCIQADASLRPLVDEFPVDHPLIQNSLERIPQAPEELAYEGQGFGAFKSAPGSDFSQAGNSRNGPSLRLQGFDQRGGKKRLISGDWLHHDQDPR